MSLAAIKAANPSFAQLDLAVDENIALLVGLEPVSQEKDIDIDLLVGLELVSYRGRERRPSNFPGERGEVRKNKN